ncbi:Anaphase-promoting complex subunit 1, partial [Coemansia sp. RSA 2598]
PFDASRNPLDVLSTTTAILLRFSAAQGPEAAVFQDLEDAGCLKRLLSRLTADVQWIICAIVGRSRRGCTPSWPRDVLALLGRYDLILSSQESVHPTGQKTVSCHQRISAEPSMAGRNVLPPASACSSSPRTVPDAAVCRGCADDIVHICEQALEQPAAQALAGDSGLASAIADACEIGRSAFSRDLRIDEADRMLNISATTYAHCPPAEDSSAETADTVRTQYLGQLARRVLALPVGRAAFSYSTHALNPQDALPIDYPRVAARFRSHKAELLWSPTSDCDTSWPLFHSGVLSALSLNREQVRRAHPSWVLLNWPSEQPSDVESGTEDDSQRRYKDSLAAHAGFILGMGLLSDDGAASLADEPHRRNVCRDRTPNGPLCDVPPWQVF